MTSSLTDIKHTASEKRAIDTAIDHIATLCESNWRSEQRLKAARKAERKERSSRYVADANCIGWFQDGATASSTPIRNICQEHDECIAMMLLGALYADKCKASIIGPAVEAHFVARNRYFEALKASDPA